MMILKQIDKEYNAGKAIQNLTNRIENWDMKDAYELLLNIKTVIRIMNNTNDSRSIEDLVDFHSLPTAYATNNVDRIFNETEKTPAYIVWAVDKKGMKLIGESLECPYTLSILSKEWTGNH